MREIWKDIRGYEGLYQISNFGRVKSLARTIYYSDGKSIYYNDRILANNVDSNGYLSTKLSKDKKPHRFRIHSLVANAFIYNPNNLPVINHLDSNKTNNHVDNLEFCTQKNNIRHAMTSGKFDNSGEKNHSAKLTNQQANEIRVLFFKFKRKVLAENYGVCRGVIDNIINKKTYKK